MPVILAKRSSKHYFQNFAVAALSLCGPPSVGRRLRKQKKIRKLLVSMKNFKIRKPSSWSCAAKNIRLLRPKGEQATGSMKLQPIYYTAHMSSSSLDSHPCSQYNVIFITPLDKLCVPEWSSPSADTASFLHGGLIESLDHWVTQEWRDPSRPPVMLKGTDMRVHQVAQGFIQLSLENLPGWRLHNFSWQLLPRLTNSD